MMRGEQVGAFADSSGVGVKPGSAGTGEPPHPREKLRKANVAATAGLFIERRDLTPSVSQSTLGDARVLRGIIVADARDASADVPSFLPLQQRADNPVMRTLVIAA